MYTRFEEVDNGEIDNRIWKLESFAFVLIAFFRSNSRFALFFETEFKNNLYGTIDHVIGS